MEPSFGTSRAPGNMRLLWHTKLAVWGSLKDGILGTNLDGNPMNASSMGGGYAPFSNGSVDNRYHWREVVRAWEEDKMCAPW